MGKNKGRIVIVAYRPFKEKEKFLMKLVERHVLLLQKEGLATNRTPMIMKSDAGDIIEIFEWSSETSIKKAHHHPKVQQLWEKFTEVCEYIPISEISEAKKLFSEFSPIL